MECLQNVVKAQISPGEILSNFLPYRGKDEEGDLQNSMLLVNPLAVLFHSE